MNQADEPPCPACAQPANRGLCHSEHCRRAVLPLIKRNAGLLRLIAEADHNPWEALVEAVSTSTLDLPPINTPGRKTARRNADGARRLASVAFGGRRGRNMRSTDVRAAG